MDLIAKVYVETYYTALETVNEKFRGLFSKVVRRKK